jgi:hypothetical protein
MPGKELVCSLTQKLWGSPANSTDYILKKEEEGSRSGNVTICGVTWRFAHYVAFSRNRTNINAA